MKSKLYLSLFILLVIIAGITTIIVLRITKSADLREEIAAYSGSESCQPCHERFYELWATSYHGLAMQPMTIDFVDNNIKSFNQQIRVGTDFFEVVFESDTLFFIETKRSGDKKKYPAIHTMGGKYIYYFLTPLSGGRLQVLPLAYDCKSESWYNNPESGVRHFETMEEDAPLDWKSHLYTFNTTCYSCHVSQLETNYDLTSNTYNTTWREPGINCETCHGPSYGHIEACVKAGEGNIPEDLKIVQITKYSQDQHNSSCGSCHAKATVIAQDFEPGARFYDYFDLITLENHDFYADGRDLGENYTMTTWEMNKCMHNSDLHCATCHTSSGRYRFAGENANDACMPCHSDKVNNVSSHTFHEENSTGSICINCHMPKTVFARMDRSDHSFRPPMPEATIAFGSPNACNICHDDQTAEWANREIIKTHKNEEYQKETLKNGYLIRKAREGDWSDLNTILDGLMENKYDNVYSTSFIRLLENCQDDAKWPVMLKMTQHESPLVRGAATHSLNQNHTQKSFDRLLQLINDDFRLVRLNAAYAISSFPRDYINESNSIEIQKALKEYEKSLVTRPDDWSAYYNLGNYYSNLNDFDKALNAYETSIRIFPEAVMSMVNAGFIYSLTNNYTQAEDMFLKALSYAPDHEAALLNLALLYGETGNNEMARQYFRRLLDVTEKNAVAAYNISILEYESNIEESVELSRKAMIWEPDNPKYAYTHAFFQYQSGNTDKAENIIENLIREDPLFLDSYYLMASMLNEKGEKEKAMKILNKAIDNKDLSNDQKQALLNMLQQLEQDDIK